MTGNDERGPRARDGPRLRGGAAEPPGGDPAVRPDRRRPRRSSSSSSCRSTSTTPTVIAAFQGLTHSSSRSSTVLGASPGSSAALVFSALIAGLVVLIRGTMSWLILAGIGASVPFGPWNMGVLWVVIRGWGVGQRAGDVGHRPLRHRQRAEPPVPRRSSRSSSSPLTGDLTGATQRETALDDRDHRASSPSSS